MNMNQFTQKTVAALERAQSLAIEYQHMQVEQEHLMLALTEDENELIPQLLSKCGLSVPALVSGLKENLDRIPRVSGSGREPGKVYIAGDVEQALLEAEKAAGMPVRITVIVGEAPKASPEENFKNLLNFSKNFDNIQIK